MTNVTPDQAGWVLRVLGIDVPAPAAAGAALPGPGPEGAVVRLAKSMLVWNQTRSNVAEQIRRLQAAIRQQTANEPDARDIEANLSGLEEILEVLDDRLTAKLNEMRGTTDAAGKGKLAAEARGIVADYQAYVASDELVNDIDDNGFVPLTIKPTVTKALAAVLQTI